jgi:hypothetical protein
VTSVHVAIITRVVDVRRAFKRTYNLKTIYKSLGRYAKQGRTELEGHGGARCLTRAREVQMTSLAISATEIDPSFLQLRAMVYNMITQDQCEFLFFSLFCGTIKYIR